jgi:hypothetical protein
MIQLARKTLPLAVLLLSACATNPQKEEPKQPVLAAPPTPESPASATAAAEMHIETTPALAAAPAAKAKHAGARMRDTDLTPTKASYQVLQGVRYDKESTRHLPNLLRRIQVQRGSRCL